MPRLTIFDIGETEENFEWSVSRNDGTTFSIVRKVINPIKRRIVTRAAGGSYGFEERNIPEIDVYATDLHASQIQSIIANELAAAGSGQLPLLFDALNYYSEQGFRVSIFVDYAEGERGAPWQNDFGATNYPFEASGYAVYADGDGDGLIDEIDRSSYEDGEYDIILVLDAEELAKTRLDGVVELDPAVLLLDAVKDILVHEIGHPRYGRHAYRNNQGGIDPVSATDLRADFTEALALELRLYQNTAMISDQTVTVYSYMDSSGNFVESLNAPAGAVSAIALQGNIAYSLSIAEGKVEIVNQGGQITVFYGVSVELYEELYWEGRARHLNEEGGHAYDPNAAKVTRLQPGELGINIDAEAFELAIERARDRRRGAAWGQFGGDLGSILGSTLGSYLGGKHTIVRNISSEFFSSIGAEFGKAASAGLATAADDFSELLGDAFDSVAGNLSQTFQDSIRNGSIGTISSFLTMEVGGALGLEGFGAELFSAAGNTLTSAAIDNAVSGVHVFSGLTPDNLFGVATDAGGAVQGVGLLSSAIGSFLGAKLGSLVVTPTTQAGILLSSIGSAVGSTVAIGALGSGIASGTFIGTAASAVIAQFGKVLGSIIVPGVGAFVGFVLGTIIGNLFGSKPPPPPEADAETILDFTTGYYALGSVTSRDGGNESLVRDMAEAARDTLNGLIGLVTYGSEIAGNANLVSPTQVYGHTANQMWVKLGGTGAAKRNFDSADEAVDHGSLWAIRQTKISGGDIYLKRAIHNSAAGSIVALSGDLQIAEDYAFYLQNEEYINAAIAEPYESLSAADKQYYDANEARFTRAMAAPRDQNGNLVSGETLSLSTADRNWYNNNKSRVDGIIDQLSVTQFAAGWIVTLQRAAELGLNETARSDFYGGLAGFADSLKLMARSDFEFEDVSFALDGNSLEVNYGEKRNLLPNADIKGSGSRQNTFTEGWSLWTDDTNGGYRYGVNWPAGANWHLDGDEGTLVVHQQDTDSKVYDLNADFEAIAGKTYTASAYTGAHRADVDIAILWFGANGEVQWSAGSDPNRFNRREKFGGDNIDQYKRIHVTGVAPSWATSGRVVIRKGSTIAGSSDSWMFVARPQVEEGSVPTDWTMQERFTAEDFLTKGDYNLAVASTTTSGTSSGVSAVYDTNIGGGHGGIDDVVFVSATGWTTSDGGDYYAHAGSNGVTITDHHTETYDVEFTTSDYGYNEQTDWTRVTVVVEGGDDIFKGGTGNDTIRGLSGFDWLEGGAGDDLIYGGSEDDVILGGGGGDRLYGEAGDDYIAVGGGDNYKIAGGAWLGAWGGDGNDTLVAGGTRARLRGEGGDDLIILDEATTGWSRYEGGSGTDTLSFERFSAAININIGAAPALDGSATWQTILGNQHIDGFENFTATEFDDTFTGDSAANVIRGLGGDDTIDAGAGNDELEGGRGADFLNGRAGWDTASYENSDFAVWVDWSEGHANAEAFGGDAEGDTFHSVEHLRGSAFDDTFEGTTGTNHLFGGRGDDWFVATGGSDHYYGEADFDTIDYSEYSTNVSLNLGTGFGYGGAAGHRYFDIEHVVGTNYGDTIYGSSGDNVFQGGLGSDHLYGGDGLDTYILHRGDGIDVINETHDGGWDTVMFGDGVSWSDLQYTGIRSGWDDMRLSIRGTSDRVDVYDNWNGHAGNSSSRKARIDEIDVGGVGAVNIQHLEGGAFGGDGNDTVVGDVGFNRSDIIFAYAGNDTIYAAGYDKVDGKDNIIIAGRGRDIIYASTGDDTYVFDRGDGFDTIEDTGGSDRIQFGPGVAAEDVIFEVVGTRLFIGIRDEGDPDKTASQVSDRIEIKNVAPPFTYFDIYSGGPVELPGNPQIEYITAGGVDIDLRKIDLWSSASSGGGSPPPSPPSPPPPASPPPPPTNSAPSAANDSLLVEGGLGGTNVLLNDSDPDGDTLTIDRINGQAVSAGDTVTLFSGNQVFVNANGFLSYFGSAGGSSDSFTYRVNDGNGETDTATVNVSITGGGGNPFGGGGGTFLFPVLIDLDGDGADVVSVSTSRVIFGSDSGGPLLRVGWVGADDGLLALDRDGDGTINRLSEISFVDDLEGARTDLEGLVAFDSNGDGVFDAADERFGEFRIWRDVNQNGFGSADELVTLEEAGIASIDLTLTSLETSLAGYRESGLINSATVTYADGTTTEGYDLALNAQLAHIEGRFEGETPDSWKSFDRNADGTFGVAHEAGHTGAEDALAELQAISGDTVGVGDVAPEQTLELYVDGDDSLEAPDAPAGSEDDPQTETFGVKPLVFDLEGDGLDLVNPAQSPIEYDADGDGDRDRLGWVGTSDALLALDRNGDGAIQLIDEISFVQDLAGAQTDLEGLRAYDDNGDGWLDANDAAFGRFQVWQDHDFDGVSQAGELKSLEEAGVLRIGLTHVAGTGQDGGALGNTVFGEASVIWADGSEGRIGDVELRAFAGDAHEQALDELQRRLNAGRTVGPWELDRSARLRAIQELSNDTTSDYDAASGLSDGVPGAPFETEGRASGRALRPAEVGGRGSPIRHTGSSPASTPENSSVSAQPLRASALTLDPDEALGLVGAGAPEELLPGDQARWWLAGADRRSGQGADALRPGTLANRLEELDAEKAAIAPANASNSSLPGESAEALAERQRFLQAIAAFRGSSGIPAMRRSETQASQDTDLAKPANTLGNRNLLA